MRFSGLTFNALLSIMVATMLAAVARGDTPSVVPMDLNPEVPSAREVNVFPKGIVELWIKALEQPEPDSKARAAQSFAQAKQRGLNEFGNAGAALIRELGRPGQDPTARIAIAHALAALDVREASEVFAKFLDTDDVELREVIEPALARWNHSAARAAWLARLSEPPPYRRRHVLAIHGLATTHETKAVPALQALVMTRTVPASVRLDAAQALGELCTQGLEKEAATLIGWTVQELGGRLAAAFLLRHHRGSAATELLVTLARDNDPTAAAIALARLIELDPKLVLPVLDSVLGSPDATVRSRGVTVLQREPDRDRIHRLGDHLSDPDPGVRSQAREALAGLAARSDLHGWVIHEGERALAGSDWRGQEQAAALVSQLGHADSTRRLIELLKVERGEAFVAAAAALRRLAVPSTLPAVNDYIRSEHKLIMSKTDRRSAADLDRQLSQLVQFIGETHYAPADSTLRAVIPRLLGGAPPNNRTPVGFETRAAAVWALGLIHEGKKDAALVDILTGRLTDYPGRPLVGAEYEYVRRMAAISLGRLKAAEAVPVLRKYYSGQLTTDPVNNACGWAIAKITGGPPPPARTIERMQIGWFLATLDGGKK